MIYALGAFDGFHMGHRQLLIRAKETASRIGTSWGVVTFDDHPKMILRKGGFKLLFTSQERDMIARALSIPKMEKIHFTKEFSSQSPREFIDFLADRCEIDGLVVGENFRFGKGRAGDPAMLAELAGERGWSLDVIPSYEIDNCVVSSTEIRRAVISGDMKRALEYLGHPFIIGGTVVKGDARGRTLGFRTANISVEHGKIYPPDGVYAALSFIDGEWRTAALNIGSNPTFEGEREHRCEAHLLGFSGELYETAMTLFLISHIRGERKFSCAEELAGQINSDIAICKKQCAEYLKSNGDIISGFAAQL